MPSVCKARPALLVVDVASLRRRLKGAGVVVVDDEPLPGFDRFYADDPFGNRLELLSVSSIAVAEDAPR